MKKHDLIMLEQFYKPDENTVLFLLYQILCEKGSEEGLTYADISKAFNERRGSANRKRSHKAQDKISTQDVAHYCKKLEKCGFVNITSQKEDSQKLICLNAHKFTAIQKKKYSLTSVDELFAEHTQPPLQCVSDDFQTQNKCLAQIYGDTKLSMREALVRLLEMKIDSTLLQPLRSMKVERDPDESESEVSDQTTPIAKKVVVTQDVSNLQDLFTVTDIANSLGMHREEKTIGRVLQELRRIHSAKIQQLNVRNGKVFQYYYSIKKKPQIAPKEPSQLGRQLIELNEKSYAQIRAKTGGSNKAEAVKKYFIALITQSDQKQASRHLTIETINRYIFCLNLVNESEQGHISELAVRSQVKKVLEKQKDFEMDKKTLRRIIDNLKHDQLIQTRDFQVTTGVGQQTVKTLLLAPDCMLTDQELMRENQTIANPTNKKIVKDESEPELKVKHEPARQEQQVEKDILSQIVRMQSEVGGKVVAVSRRKMPYFKLAWRLLKIVQANEKRKTLAAVRQLQVFTSLPRDFKFEVVSPQSWDLQDFLLGMATDTSESTTPDKSNISDFCDAVLKACAPKPSVVTAKHHQALLDKVKQVLIFKATKEKQKILFARPLAADQIIMVAGHMLNQLQKNYQVFVCCQETHTLGHALRHNTAYLTYALIKAFSEQGLIELYSNDGVKVFAKGTYLVFQNQ